MKTTYCYQVFSFGSSARRLTFVASYSSRSSAFEHARELYYLDSSSPVFVLANPHRCVTDRYVPRVWTCFGTPKSFADVCVEECSILHFLSFVG